MANENARMQILEMIETGQITADEGLRLLQKMGSGAADEVIEQALPDPVTGSAAIIPAASPEPAADVPAQASSAAIPPTGEPEQGAPQDEAVAQTEDATTSEEPLHRDPIPPNFGRWRDWWMVPFWIGVGITLLGGLFMYWALQASGIGFWFACAWFPFLIGVAVMALAWESRRARWMHIRVDQPSGEWPQRIALSFPLPLGLVSWFMRIFGHRIPDLNGVPLDEVLQALDKTTSPENPFYVEVEEGEDGERVQVFIG
jgi:hypothetical protein